MTVRFIPYIVLNGNAKEAIAFYQQALDAKLTYSQSFGEMPESPDFPIAAEAKDLIAHAAVQVGDHEIMFSDTFPGSPYQIGQQVSICISTEDASKSKQYFEALKQGGRVDMELQETFFSPAYATVTDKYGVTFHIYTQGQQQG